MKKTIRIACLTLAATAALTTSLPALAQFEALVDAKFKAADKNGDGKLTLAEARAGMPRVAANFNKIDKNNKGYVTAVEIKAAIAANS